MLRKEMIEIETRIERANEVCQTYGLRVRHIRNEAVEMTMVFKVPRKMEIVEFATSICRPDEQFDKAVGRTLAVERFIAGHTVKVPVWMFDHFSEYDYR
jgi:hypothetical protein